MVAAADPEVFAYLDYRSYLRAFYERRKRLSTSQTPDEKAFRSSRTNSSKAFGLLPPSFSIGGGAGARMNRTALRLVPALVPEIPVL
jgi:hypothetical protein